MWNILGLSEQAGKDVMETWEAGLQLSERQETTIPLLFLLSQWNILQELGTVAVRNTFIWEG